MVWNLKEYHKSWIQRMIKKNKYLDYCERWMLLQIDWLSQEIPKLRAEREKLYGEMLSLRSDIKQIQPI